MSHKPERSPREGWSRKWEEAWKRMERSKNVRESKNKDSDKKRRSVNDQ